jgi:hypothetical protein
LAIEGIEETKAGNRPVSAFRATFLRHNALRAPCSGIIGHTGARIWVQKGVLRLLRSGDNGISDESTRAHIDESRRSRVMASGNGPVRFCPLKFLQESAGCRDS